MSSSGDLSSYNIFTPGIYHGSLDPDYHEMVSLVDLEKIVELVQKRAREDGMWCIDNGFVGDNEDKMRRMMGFVSDPKMIEQAVKYEGNAGQTVDYICRDLANASKWRQ